MPPAEITRQFGFWGRKQPQARLPRHSLFCGVGTGVATPTVGPGLSGPDHLRAQVMSMEFNTRQSAPVDILAPHGHPHRLMQRTPDQQRSRGLTAGLANFGRINTINTQFAGRPPGIGAHPEGVTIRHK